MSCTSAIFKCLLCQICDFRSEKKFFLQMRNPTNSTDFLIKGLFFATKWMAYEFFPFFFWLRVDSEWKEFFETKNETGHFSIPLTEAECSPVKKSSQKGHGLDDKVGEVKSRRCFPNSFWLPLQHDNDRYLVAYFGHFFLLIALIKRIICVQYRSLVTD